jgi:peptide/nickel transport system substrate-binding protein
LALAAVAACSSGAGSGGGDGSPATRSEGGELIVVFPKQEEADAKSMDPNIGGGATYVNSIYGAIYDQLVYQDPKTGEVVPGLAEKWETSPDGKQYTFHLKKEAKFHDGTPVTAEDVKFSFDRSVDPANLPGNATGISVMAAYKDSVVIDDHTLKVDLKQSSGSFLQSAMGRTYLAIVPKAYVQKVGPKVFGQEKPMGSGPFEFVQWKHGDSITVKRNPNYTWGPKFFETAGKAPSVETIVFRFIEDASTRLAALESGQANAIQGIAPFDQARLGNSGRYDVIEVKKNGQPGGLNLNTQRFPTSELEVRQAMALAIDRDAINKSVYAGTNFPSRYLLEEKMGKWLNKDAALPEQDIEKAKQTLEDAGWKVGGDGIRTKDGKRLVVKVVCGQDTQQALTLVQAQMKVVGIQFDVQAGSTAQVSTLTTGAAGDYNASWATAGGRTNEDPYVLRTLFHSESIPPGTRGTANASRVNLPEVDQLLEKASTTLDQTERQTLFNQVQKILVDYVAYIPLLSINQNFAVVKGVHGIVSDARGTYTYWNDVFLDKSLQGR